MDVIMCVSLLLLGAVSAEKAQAAPNALSAVPFTHVKITEGFWAPWIALDREKVLPHNLQFCESEGKIANFLKAAGRAEGKHRGAPWEDSDVYKVNEGAAYCLALQCDPVLEESIDGVIEPIAAAQQPDGYLDTYFTLVEPQNRWTDDSKHETYCAGHLIEAAVAYYQATGKHALLDVAVRVADHIDSVFGPGRQTDVSEHEEIELALVKLWRLTDQEKYFKLAQFFVEGRGHTEGRKPVPEGSEFAWGEYCQDDKPVREQSEIGGHAVRAMYLYSGVTDLAAVTGDAGYRGALDRIWADVMRKMYVTGGIGPSARNEGFTVPYDLPNSSAYCETCAAIGMVFWNQRMALLHADARYADIVEREIYNGALSGVSLDGQRYFYVNPLASAGRHHRQPWHGCSCCPTNIVRFLPTIGQYVYAYNKTEIYVNQYTPNTTEISLNGASVALTQQTRYPWEGRVKILVDPDHAAAFALMLRVPGWLRAASSKDALYRVKPPAKTGEIRVKVNGERIEVAPTDKGYLRIERTWRKGDIVELDMPMPIQRIKAHPKVGADIGRTALQRGPVVFCLEGVDNHNAVQRLSLPPEARLSTKFQDNLLGGVVTIRGKALARQAAGPPRLASFSAVPYYSWDNRAPGPMVVWIPEDPSLCR